MFYTWTKPYLHTAVPAARIEMAQYLVGASVKCQMLVKLLLTHYIDRDEKMILWANEPMTLWMTELILSILSIPFVSIHAGISNIMRVKAEREFNYNPAIAVVVCSSRSCQESMNLQRGGHIQVFMDYVSASATIQMVGRSHRIGQESEVRVYRLVVDETYDQVLQAHFNAQFRSTIASLAEVKEEEAKNILKNLSHEERRDMEKECASAIGKQSHLEWATKKVRSAYADAVIRELFGFRSDRKGRWATPFDGSSKNTMPEELLFRIAYGGMVAREAVAQWFAERNGPSGGPAAKPDYPEVQPEEEKQYVLAQEANPHAPRRILMNEPPQYSDSELANVAIEAARTIAAREITKMSGEGALGKSTLIQTEVALAILGFRLGLNRRWPLRSVM